MITEDQRIARIRELIPLVDQLPWSREPELNGVIEAGGRTIMRTNSWHDHVGVLPSNGPNAELVEHMTFLLARTLQDAGTATLQDDTLDCNMNDLRVMQRLVVLWADNAFPDRTPQMALLKLFEEIGELIRSPTPTEFADILIMIVDVAHMHGVTDLGAAVREKMKINANRKWAQTELGTMQHVVAE